MLIILIGPPCAGKSTLADHLVRDHSFIRVHVGLRNAKYARTSSSSMWFSSSTHFLEYATQSWKVDYVTTDLHSLTKLQEFVKRPFVSIVSVDAPLGVRFARYLARDRLQSEAALPTLEDFVAIDDRVVHGVSCSKSMSAIRVRDTASTPVLEPAHTTGPTLLSPSSEALPSPAPSPERPSSPVASTDDHLERDPLVYLLPLASTIIRNPTSSAQDLHTSLSLPALAATLRPSWDPYFMLLATLASLRSNCMKRRVGAVLVREHRVVSTGYNGTPRGVRNCNDGGCGRCNSNTNGLADSTDRERLSVAVKGMGEGLEECLCLHAEENALLEAGRERVSGGGATGATLYCNTCPCLRCTVKIVQCGVVEVVYSLSYSMDVASRRVLEQAGIGLRQIEMPSFP